MLWQNNATIDESLEGSQPLLVIKLKHLSVLQTSDAVTLVNQQ